MNYFTQNVDKLKLRHGFQTTGVALCCVPLLLAVLPGARAAGDKPKKHAAAAPPAAKKTAKKTGVKKAAPAPPHKAVPKPVVHASKTRTRHTPVATKHRRSARSGTVSSAGTPSSAPAIVQMQTGKPQVAPLLRPIPPYQKTMPRGSYLTKPARLDNAAYQQAITRPMILQRYQYAWKTTPEETLRRLQGLQLKRLQETAVYRVYYTRANGAWGYKVRRVPAGTLIFTLPDTPRPLMLQVCGNPVEEVLPPRNARQKGGMPPPFSPSESEAGLVLEDLGDTGMYAFSPQTPDFFGGGEALSGNSGNLLSIPPVTGESAAAFGGATFPAPIGSIGGGGVGSLIFPIAGTAIGSQVINLAGNGGGGNNGGSSNGGTNGNNNGIVPEPSVGAFGVAILGTLGFALAWPTLAARRTRKPAPIRFK